ncbi:MAG: 30S ribosomal protein S12 methylthiotransferase RimO, partial [Proteobacteria bacterium]|nr:30S ribosomal protein S12 methylthiotransferase RimO [Pseudomonadota bacterium]
IVNTCGFIEQSQEQSMETVEQLAAGKRDGQLLIVAGCMTQLYGRQVKEEHPGVDHIFGVGQWQDVARLLSVDVDAIHDIPESNVKVSGPSAYLKISDGCDAPCTFCVIPKIKGGLRSAPAGWLVKEAQRLVAAGAKELVLVGQDTTAWGEDMGMAVGTGLPGMLEMLSEAVPETWLRLMYAYPSRVSPKLIETMAALPNVLPYLDVPLQHANPRILKAMKRPANAENNLARIRQWREICPDITLRSTFIVGFPGETEAEFEELLDFLREAQLDRVGCFAYSAVEGAAANQLPNAVPEEVKEDRRARFMQLQQDISRQRLTAKVGSTMTVMVDELADDHIIARSSADAPEIDGLVYVENADQAQPGDFIEVEITAADEHDLFAEAAVRN